MTKDLELQPTEPAEQTEHKVTITLPADIHEKIEKEAKADFRIISNFIAVKLIREYAE